MLGEDALAAIAAPPAKPSQPKKNVRPINFVGAARGPRRRIVGATTTRTS